MSPCSPPGDVSNVLPRYLAHAHVSRIPRKRLTWVRTCTSWPRNNARDPLRRGSHGRWEILVTLNRGSTDVGDRWKRARRRFVGPLQVEKRNSRGARGLRIQTTVKVALWFARFRGNTRLVPASNSVIPVALRDEVRIVRKRLTL